MFLLDEELANAAHSIIVILFIDQGDMHWVSYGAWNGYDCVPWLCRQQLESL